MGKRGPTAVEPIHRFRTKTSRAANGCIEWVGGLYSNGYGQFYPGPKWRTKKALAHRWYYEFLHGPIPAELDLDHLCKNRRCVNPKHLEPVTRKENVRRALVKSACINGHVFTVENTYVNPTTGNRSCRSCARAYDDARRDEKNRKRREQRAANRVPRKRSTHCRRGHVLDGENLYIAPSDPNRRHCRECRKINHYAQKAA